MLMRPAPAVYVVQHPSNSASYMLVVVALLSLPPVRTLNVCVCVPCMLMRQCALAAACEGKERPASLSSVVFITEDGLGSVCPSDYIITAAALCVCVCVCSCMRAAYVRVYALVQRGSWRSNNNSHSDNNSSSNGIRWSMCLLLPA